MAKRTVTTDREARNPEPDSGTVEMIALSETRMFEDGPQTLLLGRSDLDRLAEPSDDLDLGMSLSLEELLPDDAGEVVLVAADDVPINLLSNESVTAAGIAPEHVTVAGVEVTGLNYYSFESGVTVYSPADLLILNDPNAT